MTPQDEKAMVEALQSIARLLGDVKQELTMMRIGTDTAGMSLAKLVVIADKLRKP